MTNTAIISIVETGYYHPSNANWNYHIFMVIDPSGARLYRAVFGSESEMRQKTGADILHAGKGSSVEYKWRDIKDLLDIADYKPYNWKEYEI